jgi:hypothetical protein
MFCGKHSSNGEWMRKHIEKHCMESAKMDGIDDGTIEYGLLEGEWEEHTITVEPNIEGLRAGYYYLGFYRC